MSNNEDKDNSTDSNKDNDRLINVNTKENNYSTFKENNLSIEMNKDTTGFDLFKGILFMFLSCIFKSLFSILSKSVLEKADISSFQLLTYRTYFMLWISVFVIVFYPIQFSEVFIKNKTKLIMVIVRSFLAIISMSLIVYSMKFMHISDIYSVYYIYPGFVVIFSFFAISEKIKILDIICLFACFIGAILIVKPEFIFHNIKSKSNYVFFVFVIIAALLKGIEDVIVRNAGKEVPFVLFPILYSFVSIIICPIPMVLIDTKYPSLSSYDIFIIFLIGCCTYLYQTFMALGLQNEKAGRVSMVNYFQVAFMYISDISLFGKQIQLLDLIGTVIIFSFNFTNGLVKTIERIVELEKIKKNSITSK